MKVIVINLKRAEERRNYISKQLNHFGQNFEIFEGMDWRDIDPTLLSSTAKNLKIRKSFRPMTRGQMGCNLSHRGVLKWLADSSEEMITILEDDVRLSEDFPETLTAIENTPHNFDIIFLSSRVFVSSRRRITDLINLVPINQIYYLSLSKRLDGGALGYVITKSAAKQFLKTLPLPTGPFDDALHAYFMHGLETFTLNPQIVFHGIEGERFSYIEEEKTLINTKNNLLGLLPKFYEIISHNIYFRKRIKRSK